MSAPSAAAPPSPATNGTAWGILGALSLCHLVNDVMQSLLSAIYPLLRAEFSLSYTQIGLLTFVFQVTASIFQPVIGAVTDRHPMPRSLPWGMTASFCGVWLLALAPNYLILLVGAAAIGLGSAVFHPESSRVARLASGGRYGVAQSLFQVGGNAGSALGPLLAALIVVPYGRASVEWFTIAAALGVVLLWRVGGWAETRRRASAHRGPVALPLPARRTQWAIAVLILLVFSKFVYQASLTSFLTLYVIERFDTGPETAQLVLFLFLAGAAAGVMLGGLVADRAGTRRVIWFSILGALPFSLALPHVGLEATCVLVFVIGVIISSAFPAIVVFAQELLPGRTGMVAGLFFGFAFGIAGIAAAVLGVVADARSLGYVYEICAWLPLLGLATILLPPQRDLVA